MVLVLQREMTKLEALCCRYCVWIVGNAATLSGGGKTWKKLVADAKARNCYHALQA